MCRYAFSGPYKEHWACFKCRKSFKQTSRHELTRRLPVTRNGERRVLCPQCQAPMHDMGLDFRVPKQTDVMQWRKVEILHAHGITFHSCGCGAGPRPANLNEVPAFLEEERRASLRYEKLRIKQLKGRKARRVKTA